jgi:hypothetical protein
LIGGFGVIGSRKEEGGIYERLRYRHRKRYAGKPGLQASVTGKTASWF